MIATMSFLNWGFTSRAFYCASADFRETCFFFQTARFCFFLQLLLFNTPFFLLLGDTLVVLCTCLVGVERNVVYGADTEATGAAAEDVPFNARVVNLSKRAAFGNAVTEVGVLAKDTPHREFVKSTSKSIVKGLHVPWGILTE